MDADQLEGLESVLVTTSLGQRAYPRGKRVYAHEEGKHVWRTCGRDPSGRSLTLSLMEDNYSKKAAGELERGDYVLMDSEDFETFFSSEELKTLSDRVFSRFGFLGKLWDVDEVDSYLASVVEDELYVQAKNQLFVDVGGRTVPKFQYELLRASAKKGLVGQEVLDCKLPEGSLVLSDVEDAVNYLFKKPDEFCDLESDDVFSGYFLGNAVGPSSLDVFLGLGTVLNHEPFLDVYNEGDGGLNSFWGAKTFYDSKRKRRLNYGTLLCERVLEVGFPEEI